MYYKQQQAKLKYEGSIFETKDGKRPHSIPNLLRTQLLKRKVPK